MTASAACCACSPVRGRGPEAETGEVPRFEALRVRPKFTTAEKEPPNSNPKNAGCPKNRKAARRAARDAAPPPQRERRRRRGRLRRDEGEPRAHARGRAAAAAGDRDSRAAAPRGRRPRRRRQRPAAPRAGVLPARAHRRDVDPARRARDAARARGSRDCVEIKLHDVVSVAASARWRGVSTPSPRRCSRNNLCSMALKSAKSTKFRRLRGRHRGAEK